MAIAARRIQFDAIWDAQAERGKCDSRGGAEYTRVWTELRALDAWNADMLAKFIAWRANVQPGEL